MIKDVINIGIVSKGRLLSESKKFLKRKKLNIYSERGERELIGKVKGKPNLMIFFYHLIFLMLMAIKYKILK